jgi:hypothetical protein
MSGGVAPMAFEGETVRLFAGFAWWRAMTQQGRLGRCSDAEKMLFDAGRSILSADLFAGFWRDEAVDMDWLEDFLCDPATDEMFETLVLPETDEEEPEEDIHYSRSQLATVGSDVVEDT